MGAVIKIGRAKEKEGSTVVPVKPAKEPKERLSLPDGPQDPISSLNEATILIYGESKIGKTSLVSQFPDPLFIMFEPGGKGLKIAMVQPKNWEDFVKYVDLVLKSDKYETICIDPIALCYKACLDWVCEEEGVDEPGSVEWGRGWKKLEDQFVKQITRISNTGRGVVFLGHVDTAVFERRTGGTYSKYIPRLMKQARNFLVGFVDLIGYYGYYGDERYLTITGSDSIEAGCRLKYSFRTPSGEKIHSIPMFDEEDSTFDEERSYQNLIKAFNNKQTDVCIPEDGAALTNTPAKRDKKGRR